MLRQLKINRSTTKIQLEFEQHEKTLSAYIERRGDPSVRACLINKGKNFGNVVDFKLTKEVHLLPYGYYDLVIMNCNCECSRYPLLIEKCKTNRPATCSEDTSCSSEIRPCPDKCEVSSNLVDVESGDLCEPQKGNKIGKSDGIKLDWKITKRAK